jgi:hypothetical protein
MGHLRLLANGPAPPRLCRVNTLHSPPGQVQFGCLLHSKISSTDAWLSPLALVLSIQDASTGVANLIHGLQLCSRLELQLRSGLNDVLPGTNANLEGWSG